MATDRAIATALAYLHEAFPTRELTASTTATWADIFESVDDTTMIDAVKRCARTAGRAFFPTAGEVLAYCERERDVLDASAVLRQIERLGTYNPHVGMLPPPVIVVRDTLGDAAAGAYAAAGRERCFADDETTRHIAQRDFDKHFARLAVLHGPPPEHAMARLSAGGSSEQAALPVPEEPAAPRAERRAEHAGTKPQNMDEMIALWMRRGRGEVV
jgi:hypothetical protein